MVTLRETYSNGSIRLICRETDSFVIEVINQHITNNSRNKNNSLFVIKLQESNNASAHRIVLLVSLLLFRKFKVNNSKNVVSWKLLGKLFSSRDNKFTKEHQLWRESQCFDQYFGISTYFSNALVWNIERWRLRATNDFKW